MSLIPKFLPLFGILFLGCEASRSSGRFLPTALQDDATLDVATNPIWAEGIVDTIGPGAINAFFVPHAWDESGRLLVVYVHGLVDADAPIALPPFPGGQIPVHPGAILDSLGNHGFAVAYSSFSENGYAVRDGAQRTHQLRGLFASRFGQPTRTYVYGKSLGGLIGVMLAEKYPEQYAGVFAECGLVGSVTALIRYKWDVRRLFDYFYPGVLPGNALGVPEDWVPSLSQDTARILGAMRADMSGALAIAKIDQAPIPFRNSTELRLGIAELVYTQTIDVNDMVQRVHGRPPVSSSTFTDTGNTDGSSRLDPTLLESINRETLHYDAAPDAANFLANFYEPSGDLRTHVMTFTSSWDPRLPPILNDSIYYDRVEAAGRLEMLRQREPAKPDVYGHCTIRQSERLPAFLNFVRSVESTTTANP